MSDLDKLFENAPEGAVEIQKDHDEALYWVNGSGDYWDIGWRPSLHAGWQTIATRQPERKTVGDAVADCVCVKAKLEYEWDCVLHDGESYYFVGGDYADKWEHQLVCTREEFEACVAAKAKSEPEWTHGIPPNEIYCKVNHGGEFVNCYLIGRDDMGAFVYRIDGQYYSTMSESNLKPIKPTITTSEKEKCAAMAGYFNINPAEFDEYMSKYEVVEQLRKEQEND
jgi:hypothetical protein